MPKSDCIFCRDSESDRCYICGRGVARREPPQCPLWSPWERTDVVIGKSQALAASGVRGGDHER